MRRSNATVLILLAVAALGSLLVVTDPLDLFSGGRAEEVRPPEDEVGSSGGPRLEGASGATQRTLPRQVDGEPVGVATLTLGDARLTGRVTGAGTPLALARVEPILPAPFRAAVRTDAEGRFELRGLPEGTLDLRASAEGWRSRTALSPALVGGASAQAEPIDLDRRPAFTDGLEVRITDLEGRPLPGANVLATTLTWSVDVAIGAQMAGMDDVVRKSATSDERGVALLEGLPPEDYDVVASAPGRATTAVEGVHVARGRLLPLTLRLGPGLSISGKVVDGEGKPIAGAYAFGLHQPSWVPCMSVRSAADGTFTLDGLRDGSYMLIVGDEGHGSAVRNRVASPSGGHVIELKGAATLEGRVTTPEGKPVPAFSVRPAGTQPFGYEYSRVWQVTDAEGRFRLSLPEGPYEVRVRTPEGAMGSTKVQLTAGQSSSVAVQVGAAAVVRGVVTDADGKHLEAAEVYVNLGGMPGGPSREQYARTDADGHFEVGGLALEKVVLHVRHARHADTKWEGPATPAQGSSEVTIRMSGGASVGGRITRADGKGAAGEQVNLYQGWFEARTVFCDGDGAYRFDHVAQGKWNLSTGPFENGAGGLSKNGIDVGSEGSVTVDLAYSTAQGVVTGVVTSGGKPVVGATVYVSDERGTGQSVTVKTDEQGAFEAQGVASGRVQVYVESPEGLTTTRSARLDAETRRAQVRIEFGTAALKGRCLGSDDVPVSSAWVNVERAEGGGGAGATVASRAVSGDGSFDLRGVSAGTFRLRIWAGGYAQVTTEPFTLAESESKDLGTIRIPRGGDVSGRVTDDTGSPVESATISLKDEGGRPVFTFSLFTTGSDGRFTVQGVLPGRYTVGAEARGLAPGSKEVDVGAQGAQADLVLARGGSVRVLVVDDAGRPLEGARVALTDAAGIPVTRTLSLANFFDSGRDRTGAGGEVTIPDLAAGAYRLQVTLAGYALSGDEVGFSVSSGGTAVARVPMIAEAPPPR